MKTYRIVAKICKTRIKIHDVSFTINFQIFVLGIIHTPLVHHIVRMINGHDSLAWASQSGYYDMLEHGFRDLCATGPVEEKFPKGTIKFATKSYISSKFMFFLFFSFSKNLISY